MQLPKQRPITGLLIIFMAAFIWLAGMRATTAQGDGDGAAAPAAQEGGEAAAQDIEPGADIVVVWEDDQDENGKYQIHGRGLSTFGNERFSQRVINAIADGQQRAPAVAVADNGDTVVVWEDDADENGFYQIRARVLRADGSEKIPDFTVNSIAGGQQRRPAVAAAGDGRFVVAWEDDADENGFYQIRARVFRANGSEAVADFTVNSTADGQQLRPVVAMADDGSFVVVWEDDTDENDYYQIKARGFRAGGSERFGDVTVNSAFEGQQLNPDMAMDNDGNFVVVWEDDQDENGYFQIYGRGFNRFGSERFSDIVINTAAAGQQRNPRIAMAGGGDFVVVWEDDRDNNEFFQILARGFTAGGSQRFTDVTVNSIFRGQQLQPDVAMADNGDFVVVWQDDADENGLYQIRARGFAADSSERFDDITVNSVAEGQQLRPSVSMVRSPQARVAEVTMCVYRTLTTAEQTHFENIMEFFADSIYEMSNGAHKIGEVTVIHDTLCRFPSVHIAFDIYWDDEEWPNADLAGSDPGEAGLQVFMGDVFPFDTEMDALDPANADDVGYTLGHEYGHYFYGLSDEYDTEDGDVSVPDSVMADQWDAENWPADNSRLVWLNFSVAHKFVGPNNQWRNYGASGWTTLARAPFRCFVVAGLRCRTFYPELAERAPANNVDAPFELNAPGGVAEARSHLDVEFDQFISLQAQIPPQRFVANIDVLPDENVSYPDPVVIVASVADQALITNAGVSARVRYPDESTAPLALADDGQAPDERARDGRYTGYMRYERAGTHRVSVTFDDNQGQAVYTELARDHTPGPDGDIYIETFPPVGESFSSTATTDIVVGNVVADDHGGTPAAATRILDNNGVLNGRIDRPGDTDLFHVFEVEPGERVVRVARAAFGMTPVLTLLDGEGQVLERIDPALPQTGDYFWTTVNVAAGQELYLAVSDADPNAAQGAYSISIGDRLANETQAQPAERELFLAIIMR